MKKIFTMFCAAAALTVFIFCGAAYAGEAPSDVFKNTLDEYRRGEYVRCSYALHDIDANGTDELLVRYSYDESPYEDTKIYTYANGTVNEIGEFWPRNLLLLDKDGGIYSMGSSGAGINSLEVMKISDDGTELVISEAWEMDYPNYTHVSKDGMTEVISESDYKIAAERFYSMTTDFVDSLDWQSLISANGAGANSSSGADSAADESDGMETIEPASYEPDGTVKPGIYTLECILDDGGSLDGRFTLRHVDNGYEAEIDIISFEFGSFSGAAGVEGNRVTIKGFNDPDAQIALTVKGETITVEANDKAEQFDYFGPVFSRSYHARYYETELDERLGELIIRHSDVPGYIKDKGKYEYNPDAYTMRITDDGVSLRSEPGAEADVAVTANKDDTFSYYGEWTDPEGEKWVILGYNPNGADFDEFIVWARSKYAEPLTLEQYSALERQKDEQKEQQEALKEQADTALSELVKSGTARDVEAALKNGADVNMKYEGGSTTLIEAAMNNPNPDVITALVNAGADVNAANQEGFTPLLAAANNNTNPDVITALADAGADLNAVNSQGVTALMIAALRNPNAGAVITNLLKAGADPDIEIELNGTTYKAADMLVENAALMGDTDAILELRAKLTSADEAQANSISTWTANPRFITFGSYNGHDLRWRVLEEYDDKTAFLVLDGVLRKPAQEGGNALTMAFSDETNDITNVFPDSSISKWLNDTFLPALLASLSTDDADCILDTAYTANYEDYDEWGRDGKTTSKIFLLSSNEARNPKYFFKGNVDVNEAYWLRSPGLDDVLAASVWEGGSVTADSSHVRDPLAVRPALKIDLSSPVFASAPVFSYENTEKARIGEFVRWGRVPQYIQDKGQFYFNDGCEKVKVTGDNVRLRSQPNTGSHIMAAVNSGDEYALGYLGEWTNPQGEKWIFADYYNYDSIDQGYVWVHGDYVELLMK